MQIRQFLCYPCYALIGSTIIILIGIQSAFAIETLPAVTVTSPREPLTQIINNTRVLDQGDLSIAHERSLYDVLQGFPGLSVTKVGGYGQVGALFMRGAGGQGLVSLDDIPLMLSVPGFQNLDTLPAEAIQRAEIERGPGTVYYPFQSLGGAIRLYTQDREDTGATLSVEGGSFGILRETLQGGLNGSLGKLTVTLSRGDAFEGTHLANAANNPEREPFRFSQGILRFSADLNSRLNWQGSMLYRQSWLGLDKFGIDNKGQVASQDDTNSFGREESWLAQNSLDFRVTSTWKTHLQIGFTQSRTTAKAGALQNGVFSRLYLANWRNRHTLIDDEEKQVRWHLTWGGQGRHEQGQSPVIGFSEERTMAAGFVETVAQYGSLSGEAGVRVEHFDQFGDHPLFKTAVAWRIMPDLTLRASGGTGYRIPSYTELHFLFFGNPQLRPEHSASGDLGIEWYPVKDLQLTVNGYYHRYDDLITPAYHLLRGPITLNVAGCRRGWNGMGFTLCLDRAPGYRHQLYLQR
ncbi:MAG: TonB-dependent receptor plug domain-containing protein [Methylobacter sp.]